ncbi:MAG: hypothetical protein ABSB88_13610 [Bryobacteraceae bacterium]
MVRSLNPLSVISCGSSATTLRREKHQTSAFNSLAVDPHNRILVETAAPESSAIVYHLDFNLNVVEFHISDNCAAVHERYYRQHLLDHPLSAAETALLGKVAAFNAAPDGNSPELSWF